jgi:C1A family cysteine protease
MPDRGKPRTSDDYPTHVGGSNEPHALGAALAEIHQRNAGQHPDSPPLPSRATKGLGYIPDVPSARDYIFDPHVKMAERQRANPTKAEARKGVAPRVARIKVPARVDLRVKDPVTGSTEQWMPDPYDQSALGSCVPNASGGADEYEQRREGVSAPVTPSRLALYYWCREIIGTTSYDSGAYVRDAFTVLNKIGAPAESIWPYNIGAFTQRPPQAAYDDAAKRQTLTFARIPTGRQTDCKLALATGTPVVFGFTVYDSFFDTGADGVVKVPDIERESVAAGHAVVMVGYEKLRSRSIYYAIVRNSWGTSWGDAGYCYFPMSWLMNEYNADDFWCIQALRNAAMVRASLKRAGVLKRAA